MRTLISFVQQHSFVAFCALTIVLTYAVAALALPPDAMPIIIVFIPALVAIILEGITDGKTGVKALIGKLAFKRDHLRWYAIALLLALVMRGAVAVLAYLLGFISEIQISPFTFLHLIIFVFAAGEELGWRGYVLPRLLAGGRSPLAAALIIGVFWGIIHLVLFLPVQWYSGLPVVVPSLLNIVAISILLTWLCQRTGGGILAAVLLHGGQNALTILHSGVDVVSGSWLLTAVTGVMALIVAVRLLSSNAGSEQSLNSI
jgi:uncharacterized protein